jgi:hypothetical protein
VLDQHRRHPERGEPALDPGARLRHRHDCCEGQVVRDAAVLGPGDSVTARFARGEADCEVLRTRGNLTGAEVVP